MDKKQELLELCEKFVLDNRIRCPETVSQCDRVIISAYEFLEKMCDIVGYYEDEEE